MDPVGQICITQPPADYDHTNMARLTTRDEASLSSETLEALEPVRMNGKLAPVYLQYANSEPALRAYLQMEQALVQGNLDDRTLETIKLAVSQRTGCDFCLSVHTFKGKKVGLDETVQLAIRRGEPTGDEYLDVVLEMVSLFLTRRGSLPDPLMERAQSVGLTQADLLDVCLAVSTIVFTNIANHVNDTESSLPPAPSI